MVTTTSDDRSVKVWQFKKYGGEASWSKSSLRPLRSMFGHTARVFRSKIIVHGKILLYNKSKWSLNKRKIQNQIFAKHRNEFKTAFTSLIKKKSISFITFP